MNFGPLISLTVFVALGWLIADGVWKFGLDTSQNLRNQPNFGLDFLKAAYDQSRVQPWQRHGTTNSIRVLDVTRLSTVTLETPDGISIVFLLMLLVLCWILIFTHLLDRHVMNQMQRRMDAVFDDVIPVQFWESDFMLSRRKG